MKAIQKNKKKWDSFKLFLYILPFLIMEEAHRDGS